MKRELERSFSLADTQLKLGVNGMSYAAQVLVICLGVSMATNLHATDAVQQMKIARVEPAEKGFFAKRLDFYGIPIKAPEVVVDEALHAAAERLSMLTSN